MTTETQHESKTRLLEAAFQVFRTKGYAASTVDDICKKAGVTKGSFFHHFKSKDELGIAAASHWGAMSERFFATAECRKLVDPLDRLLGYLDFRDQMLQGDLPDFTCPLGTLIQETYTTHPSLTEACAEVIYSHIAELTRDIEAAKRLYAPEATWSAESVAFFIQTVLQGSFIFAKANQSPEVVRESTQHLRRYLTLLFSQPANANHKEKRS